MHNELTITFPNTPNGKSLHDILVVTVANKDFMDDTKKIKKAVEILTPKSTLTATFKRLQGNVSTVIEKYSFSVIEKYPPWL